MDSVIILRLALLQLALSPR